MNHLVLYTCNLLLFSKKIKGPCGPLCYLTHFERESISTLLVVDVHGDFEAKAHVVINWCFPFHDNSPEVC